MSKQPRGFSLVELSIVLVILGLLVGGVLSGQSLIRAAELRSVTADYSRYVAAISSFRDKYFALPGDMANAGSFWGVDTTANCDWASSTAGTGTTTCNGDGDGRIIVNYTSPSNEPFRSWQHLASAGLVEGSYNGLCSPCWPGSAGGAVPGQNVPKSRISNAGWTLYSFGTMNVAENSFF